MRYMKKTLAPLLLALTFSGCGPREFRIDNETLALFGVQWTQAAEQRNAGAIAANYATNAVIDIQLPAGTYPFTGVMNRDEYKTKLETLLKNCNEYSINWGEMEINIAADGKSATATALRTETFVFPTGPQEFKAKESMELALAERKIVLVRQTLAPLPQ